MSQYCSTTPETNNDGTKLSANTDDRYEDANATCTCASSDISSYNVTEREQLLVKSEYMQEII